MLPRRGRDARKPKGAGIPSGPRTTPACLCPDSLIRQGLVRDYADLARLGGVSRARITQIMNLLNLPPWKQEELLFLKSGPGRAAVTEREVRSATKVAVWVPRDKRQ